MKTILKVVGGCMSLMLLYYSAVLIFFNTFYSLLTLETNENTDILVREHAIPNLIAVISIIFCMKAICKKLGQIMHGGRPKNEN